MVVVACKPSAALSRAGVAPNTVKALPGAPAKAAVIGRPVSASSCCQPSRTARSSLRSLPRPVELARSAPTVVRNYLALQLVVEVGVARQPIDVEAALRERATGRDAPPPST